MSSRPTFTEIVDWMEGRLPSDRAHDVAEAVAHDDAAADAAAWVAEFLATAERLQMESPPADLRGRLRALFNDPARDLSDGAWERARLLYARSARDAAPSGAETHLAFEFGAGRFVLVVAPASHGYVELRGQLLLATPPGPADVTLLEGGVVRGRSRSAADGRFRFALAPASVDELRIAVGGLRVTAQLEPSRA